MIKQVFITTCMFCCISVFAQKTTTIEPMNAKFWEFEPNTVQFTTYKGVKSIQSIKKEGMNILLKDFQFAIGTIEYDIEIKNRNFPGIGFRSSADKKNADLFYLRCFGKPDSLSRYSTQYAAVVDNTNLWDITDPYQAAANIRYNQWNHVKLVISEHQMKVYVNDMNSPILHIPDLEGPLQIGSIYLTGDVTYANIKIKPNETENLANEKGANIMSADSHYIKNWSISEAVNFPFNRGLLKNTPQFPGFAIDSTLLSTSKWKLIEAKHRNVVNLTEKFGNTPFGERRLVWLKTTIVSEKDQVRKLKLGFSDEIWVFQNGSYLYSDKNLYGSAGMKEPRGRCSLDNAEIELQLKKGSNEILVGITNYFYAWGLIARLDATDDLHFKN